MVHTTLNVFKKPAHMMANQLSTKTSDAQLVVVTQPIGT